MTFPTNPTNGQAVTLNGVEYTYNSTKTAWLKTTAGSGTVPATVSGTLTVTGNANVGNLGTATAIITTANIITINSGLAQNGNSNVSIVTNGNVTISATGTANVVSVANTGATVTGNITLSGNIVDTAALTISTSSNGNLTLSPNGTGVVISTANTIPNGNATLNLGSATARWSTVFTGDLDLSNGIGDWTIVEGEEDLFIYNNKKNKVYKFNLIEVDPTIAPPKKGD